MAGFASRLSQSHEVTLITLGRAADDLYDLDTNVERVDLDTSRGWRAAGAASLIEGVELLLTLHGGVIFGC